MATVNNTIAQLRMKLAEKKATAAAKAAARPAEEVYHDASDGTSKRSSASNASNASASSGMSMKAQLAKFKETLAKAKEAEEAEEADAAEELQELQARKTAKAATSVSRKVKAVASQEETIFLLVKALAEKLMLAMKQLTYTGALKEAMSLLAGGDVEEATVAFKQIKKITLDVIKDVMPAKSIGEWEKKAVALPKFVAHIATVCTPQTKEFLARGFRVTKKGLLLDLLEEVPEGWARERIGALIAERLVKFQKGDKTAFDDAIEVTRNVKGVKEAGKVNKKVQEAYCLSQELLEDFIMRCPGFVGMPCPLRIKHMMAVILGL